MTIRFKLLTDKAKAPEFDGGVLYFKKAAAMTGIGEDGRVIPILTSDVEITLPEEIAGMFVPGKDLFSKSLMFAGGQGVLPAGYSGPVSCPFKIDTPSLAVVPEDGEVGFGLFLFRPEVFDMEEVISDVKVEAVEGSDAGAEYNPIVGTDPEKSDSEGIGHKDE